MSLSNPFVSAVLVVALASVSALGSWGDRVDADCDPEQEPCDPGGGPKVCVTSGSHGTEVSLQQGPCPSGSVTQSQ